LFAYSPTSSFFFVSTLITGSPGVQEHCGESVDMRELDIAVGMRAQQELHRYYEPVRQHTPHRY
jgi:hypothetical protein